MRICVLYVLLQGGSPWFLAAENFHSFRDVRSLEWHTRRHAVAQSFLDQFVRQVSRYPFNKQQSSDAAILERR